MYGGEFRIVEDDLVDYNDPDVLNDEQPSHTPVQTPQALDSENEGEDEVKGEEVERDLVESQEAKSIREHEAMKAKRIQEFEALNQRLSENGFKMRMKVWADPAQSFRPISMIASSMTLAETLREVPLEDAEQISEFQGLVYMPAQFMQKYLLPTMQIRKLLETESELARGDQPLPGGPETAIMYALYHQAKSTQATTLDSRLRSLITHSHTDTDKLVKDITENMMAKEKSLEHFTNQLREVTTLPTVQTICRMNADDVKEKNQLISSVLTNFEQQLKRDYKAYERERHQNVLIAKLNYEQQLHLIDANRKHVELSEQKRQIIEEAIGLDVQFKVATIKDSLNSLQEELAQQCRDLSLVLGPINTPHLMETMKRMKHALEDVTFQNAYLVLNNNELTLENSYLTPVQRSTIDKIRADRTRYYTQQRVTPHYIEDYPQGTVMFQPHNNMQIPCATYVIRKIC